MFCCSHKMAVEPGDVKFVSKLDEAGKKKAKDELHELNEKDRGLAVQALRKWVLEQDWLTSPTDFDFLLRFVRTRKYSQLSARETLENYWTNRTMIPEWFENIDPANKKIQEIIRSGVMYCPRGCDKHGRRVIFSSMKSDLKQLYRSVYLNTETAQDLLNKVQFDLRLYFCRRGGLDLTLMKTKKGMDLLYATCVLICDWLACDENVQVNGIVFVSDYTGVSMDFLRYWNPEYEKKLLGYFQKSLPARFKAFHLYKEPMWFDAMYTMISQFMSQKFKDRMFLHNKSLVKIYEDLGMEIFPDVYIPDDYDGPSAGSAEQIIDHMIEDMMKPEFRNHILEISNPKYGVNLQKRKAAEKTPAASFRKLNID